VRQEKSGQAGTRAARCAREGRRAFLTCALAAFAIPHVRAAQESDHHSGADHADQPDEPVFDLGDGITPPKVIHQVIPKPDSGEQGFRISGVVLIGLVVSSRGLPVNVHVVHSVDKDVDQNALDAVREWRFEPARKGDKPVAVRLTIEIRFHDV
jgi:protein TonB